MHRDNISLEMTFPSVLPTLAQLLVESDFHGSYSDWHNDRGVINKYIIDGSTVLDVGCANGLLLASLLEWHPDVFIPFGFDISSERIRCAKSLLLAFANNFFVHNLWRTPWPIAKVDIVIAPWIASRHFIANCLNQARMRVIFTVYSDRVHRGCDLLAEIAQFQLNPLCIEAVPGSTQIAVVDVSTFGAEKP
jgi:SAM-dependent methyltransferase